jgi:hypothetical protein
VAETVETCGSRAAVEGQIAPLHFPAAVVDIAAIWPARK